MPENARRLEDAEPAVDVCVTTGTGTVPIGACSLEREYIEGSEAIGDTWILGFRRCTLHPCAPIALAASTQTLGWTGTPRSRTLGPSTRDIRRRRSNNTLCFDTPCRFCPTCCKSHLGTCEATNGDAQHRCVAHIQTNRNAAQNFAELQQVVVLQSEGMWSGWTWHD